MLERSMQDEKKIQNWITDRLSQKGYSVAILEMGKRYRTGDFGKTNWNIKKFIWVFFH